MACGMLFTQPGIEPTSSALQGWFLTAGPPGKFLLLMLCVVWNPPNWKLSLRADTICCVRLSGGKSAIFGANFDFPIVIVPRSVQETLIILSELHRVLGKNL